MRFRVWWGFGALLVAALAIGGTAYWWFAQVEEMPMDNLQPLDPEEVALGQVVYQTSCAQCHGLQGEGQPNWRERNADGTYRPPPHDSSGHTWHHSDGLLFRIVRDGGKIYEDPGFKSGMPAFGDRLSSEEIQAVITYLKSLWDQEERAFQAQVSLEDPFPEAGNPKEQE
jgi:mono/diheme cytochrome c family protein